MAKNTFNDFSTTASSNTDIAGIDIQGTAAVANFDNALRTLMAILRTDLDNGQVFVTKAAGYTALAADNNAFYEFTAAATLALTAAATLAADWHMMVFANGGAVTIDPDGAELINGAATLVVADGDAAYIICTGTAFKAITIAAADSSPRGHLYGLTLSNNATDATNDIDIAAGEAASDDTNPHMIVLASALTKRLDAAWAVGTGNGGLDTGSIADTTYHVWLIQRSDTGVVDALFSASATSPTMPTNYDRKRRIGGIKRESSAILGFKQVGNRFLLNAPSTIRSSTSGATDDLVVCTAPAGIRVRPILSSSLAMNTASSGQNVLGDGDATTASFQIQAVNGSGLDTTVIDSFYTNTSGEIRFSTSTGTGTYLSNVLNSIGWWDDRGKSDD